MNKIAYGLVLGSLLSTAPLWAAMGQADVMGTAPNSPIKGVVKFEDTPAGLKVSAQLTGVPAGEHAFHIHEFGSCADMGKAAGSHYNPMNAPHGQVLKVGIHHAHAGDLGNIMAGEDGTATMEAVIPGINLSGGLYDVAGRAVILHEKIDDFSQPAGNAGGRIACGPIVMVGTPAPAAVPAAAPPASK